GPPINTSSSQSVNTGSVGVEIASIGGTGGNGGNSYASFWDGRSGGSGGAGGSVIYEETVPSATQTNDPCIAANSCTVVQTSGANNYGIFVYSQGGAGGNGGSGYAAPGGGAGGHSSNGGNVGVTTDAGTSVITVGDGAYGIYGL